MSDFKYIGKNIVCEPYTFRSSITASNITASGIIYAKKFVGSIDSASVSVSSSYALTASYALNGGSGGTSLTTGSTYPITASWSISSSYAVTSSISYIITSSYSITSSYIVSSSFASSSINSLYALSSSFASSSISSSYALSSSYSLTSSYALNAGTKITTGSTYPITSSWSLNTISSSYALTASYALNSGTSLGTGSTYPITASWANNAVSSSYSLTSSYVENTISSSYALSSSYSTNSNSSSYSLTASYALNSGTTLTTGSYYPITSSWSNYSVSSSYSLTSSYTNFAQSSSNALTASFVNLSQTASYVTSSNIVGTVTSASYAITSSYAFNSLTSSFANSSSYSISSSYALSASYAPTNTNITASWAFNSISSSYALTASYALNAGSGTSLGTGSTYPITSSWSLYSISSSYADTALSSAFAYSSSWAATASYLSGTASNALSSSYALTASYALNAGGTSLETGSTYPITSSWSLYSVTASYFSGSVVSSSYSLTSSYSDSSLYALTASYVANLNTNSITSPNSQTSVTANNNSISASLSGSQILTVTPQSITSSQNGLSSFELNGRLSASNVNVGVPSDSYPWGTSLIGSYFSTWNSNTNVSDILRFFAGAFSSSYPTPSPNTKTFASITTTSTLGSTISINGRVPTGSTNVNINYLQPLGWATVGSTIFSGYTFRGGTNYLSYGSNTGGSTTVSSSLGSSAFGLGPLTNGSITPVRLSGSFTVTFASSSVGTVNYTNTSSVLLTQATINTSVPTVAAPISLNSIPSANTAVIPSVYQDGYFNNFTGSNLTNSISLSSVSSSGIYVLTGTVGINSGSSPYTFYNGTNTTVNYTPLTDASFSNNSITSPNSSITASTVITRSLSGVPYLTSGSTYKYTVTASGAFNPLYFNGTVSTVNIPANNLGLVSANSTTLTTNPTIQTAGVVKSSDYVTTRSVGSYPYESDVIVFDVTMAAAATTNTVAQSGSSISTFTVNNTTYNRAGSGTTIGAQTVNVHTAGSFGLPSSSGSLLYYGRPEGYVESTLTFGSQSLSPGANNETFADEAYRLILNDGLLSFNGTSSNSSSYLTTRDLQVKPGYLVDSGGTYRYWYPSGYGTTYKYYVRRFKTTVVVNSLRITLSGNTTLVGWNSTSTGMAVALLFESGCTPTYTNCRLYDVSNTGQNLIASNVTPTDSITSGTNPFGSNIDLYGNNGTGASNSGGVIVFPMRTADGAVLDNTNTSKDEVYVLVRFNGSSTTPVTNIKIEKLS